MRFAQPNILFLLIPLLLYTIYLFYRIGRERRQLKRFGDTDLVKELMPDLSLRRRLGKDLLLVTALALMVLALARPQMGAKRETITKEGIEMMVCLDISNSMLSDDVVPSRLERAKAIVSRMMDELGNNKIGLVYFAGDAFIQLPITADFISAKMFLSNADPEMIQVQGTEIGMAIELATRSFSSDTEVQKAIVLITDVENHEGNVLPAIEAAKKEGILVNVVGIGSPEGGPIPIADGGYLLDSEGNMVVTKLNEQMGREIVAASGGVYIRANDVTNTVRELKRSIDELESSELETTIYNVHNEVYYLFLIPAILLIIVDFIYLDRKNRYLRRLRLFDNVEE